MHPVEPNLADLPEDSVALQALLRSLLVERDREKQRADEQKQRAETQSKRADGLHVENLRLQQELERLKKQYHYCPAIS